jgi:phosphoglycolate phosphatase
MKIKALLFDKDGTLIDVNGTWVPLYRHLLATEFEATPQRIEEMMVAVGYDPQTDLFRPGSILAGGTTLQLVEQWWPDAPAQVQQETAVRLDRRYAPMARELLRPLMPLQPILAELKKLGFSLGVGTNDSEISARGHMEALGVNEMFDIIIGADSVTTPKPSGEMIKLFAETLGILPREIAMVGDNVHDMEEAHNGGAGLAIAVLSGNSGRVELEPHAHHVLGSVADLPAFLRDL